MRAVQLHGKGDIRFATIAEPGTPGRGDVLVRVEAAGICGSDIHNFRTGQWISRTPSVPGHEFAGTVEAVGAGVTGFGEGDRVVADSRYWCGECQPCRSGHHHLCNRLGFVGEVCDGGFAERIILPARLLLKTSANVPASVAATAEPLAVALHAVRRLALPPGAEVVVTGCGMIGALVALLLARTNGVRVADRNAARAELVAAVTGARIVDIEADGLKDTVGAVEATGSAAVLKSLVSGMPGGSRLALVGIFHGALEIDPNLLVERELALIGCHAFQDELAEAVKLLPELAPGIARLLGEPIRLEDVPEAYRRIIAGEEPNPKTIIRP